MGGFLIGITVFQLIWIVALHLRFRYIHRSMMRYDTSSIQLIRCIHGRYYIVKMYKEVDKAAISFKRIVLVKGLPHAEVGLDNGNSHFIPLP
jgi:hypothetical protein